jgi:broad specificity phosphatase PhoE
MAEALLLYEGFMATHIVLVRHGQTGWNLEERFRGTADVALNARGTQQAEAAARRLSGEPIRAVYSSPLVRAQQTAGFIADPHGLSVEVVDAFASVDYGDWEGMLESEVAEQYPDLYRRYRTRPDLVDFPNGESLAILRTRAMTALGEIFRLHPDERVVVVTHQVVTRTVLCAVLGVTNAHYWRLAQGTACINRFTHDASGGLALVAMNDLCHLEGSGATEGEAT